MLHGKRGRGVEGGPGLKSDREPREQTAKPLGSLVRSGREKGNSAKKVYVQGPRPKNRKKSFCSSSLSVLPTSLKGAGQSGRGKKKRESYFLRSFKSPRGEGAGEKNYQRRNIVAYISREVSGEKIGWPLFVEKNPAWGRQKGENREKEKWPEKICGAVPWYHARKTRPKGRGLVVTVLKEMIMWGGQRE